MKIQSLSILSPVKTVSNIKFCGQRQRVTDLSELNDVFVKTSSEENFEEPNNIEPKLRYYYLGADDEAHETTAPFITRETEFGERLYIIRSGKPRAFSGFTVEKTEDRDITTIFDSGYPSRVFEERDCDLLSSTYYDPETHKVVEKQVGNLRLVKAEKEDGTFMELHIENDDEDTNIIFEATNDAGNKGCCIVSKHKPGESLDKDNHSLYSVLEWSYPVNSHKYYGFIDKNEMLVTKNALSELKNALENPEFSEDFGGYPNVNYQLNSAIRFINRSDSEQ